MCSYFLPVAKYESTWELSSHIKRKQNTTLVFKIVLMLIQVSTSSMVVWDRYKEKEPHFIKPTNTLYVESRHKMSTNELYDES